MAMKKPEARDATDSAPLSFCTLRVAPEPAIPPGLSDGRARAMVVIGNKWANGTVLRFYFFDQLADQSELVPGSGNQVTWVGDDGNREVVRSAFQKWKELGIGLVFEEVADRNQADIRIGFQLGDGSWSYVGKGIRGHSRNDRTMNFGWDLAQNDYGLTTALHEIGHTLGMPHEHQNPSAGIEWDEERVYQHFASPPNRWGRETTQYNVLRKLSTGEIEGSAWDPDSVMHYEMAAGLIVEPSAFAGGVFPPGTLSAADKAFGLRWYPTIDGPLPKLKPFESARVSVAAGQQVNYELVVSETRSYTIATFGSVDTLLTLFDDGEGSLEFIKGDDDSGTDRNAQVVVPLVQGRTYIVRVRLYHANHTGEFAVMCS